MLCNGRFVKSLSWTPLKQWTRPLSITTDPRHRLTRFWTPTETKQANDDQDILIRAGFIRQAHSGIFHLLPLGLRVQDKIERLLDEHMRSLGAAKVSLSSITSEQLWTKSGRLDGRNAEFFHLTDRKGAKFLLSPTHEEEITTIARTLKSYKDLPLRLYQVSRKYRDEARPRQGLLRGREFLMKDLYTFDVDDAAAQLTYADVRKAYRAFFNDLRLRFTEAAADSGNMGGSLSHEYHLISKDGEDTIISCEKCDFAANEEVFTPAPHGGQRVEGARMTYAMSKDRKTFYNIITPDAELNMHIVKKLIPDMDPSIEVAELPQHHDKEVQTLADPRCNAESSIENRGYVLTTPHDGDSCPSCGNKSLIVRQAIEIGHTFHLGTRYSKPLGAKVLNADNQTVAMQMGCHGVGVSRLIAAASGLLTNKRGLSWPLVIAPFEVVLLASSEAGSDLDEVYDLLSQGHVDAVIDDRRQGIGYKLKDAELVGYPFIVVLGRGWADKKVELQCKRLGVKQDVSVDALLGIIKELSAKL